MIENLNIPGIYKICNTKNGVAYVGSAVNIRKRWNEHRRQLRLGQHNNPRLLNSWRAHGEDAFVFSVIEVVTDPASLIDREQFWIDSLKTVDPAIGFNINPNAASRLGAKVGDAGRRNMSTAKIGNKKGIPLSEDHRAKIGASRRGKLHTEETKARMSKAASARTRKPMSEETKAKIGNANKSRKMPPVSRETRLKLAAAAREDWARRKLINSLKEASNG